MKWQRHLMVDHKQLNAAFETQLEDGPLQLDIETHKTAAKEVQRQRFKAENC